MRRVGTVATVLFVATVFAANWAIQHVGTVVTPTGVHLIPVWSGVYAPSGVLFVGLAFTLRDIVDRALGRWWVIAAIAAGAAASYLVSPAFAGASAAAFLVSELADLVVYEPLSRKTFLGGVVASNIVGTVVDSALFLWLALGSLALIEGQIIGKLWMTAAALPVVLLLRKRIAPCS